MIPVNNLNKTYLDHRRCFVILGVFVDRIPNTSKSLKDKMIDNYSCVSFLPFVRQNTLILYKYTTNTIITNISDIIFLGYSLHDVSTIFIINQGIKVSAKTQPVHQR